MALPLRHANNGPVTWTHVLRQCSITTVTRPQLAQRAFVSLAPALHTARHRVSAQRRHDAAAAEGT